MRTRTRLVTAALAGVLALAGCGIPDNTEVLTRGAGPSTGVSSGGGSVPPQSTRASTIDNRLQFVQNYLEAAAGDPKTAAKRVGEFLAPGLARTFKPQEVRVVRVSEEGPLINPDSPDVRVRVQQVGVLRADGVLMPASSPNDTTEYTIKVAELEGQPGYFVTQTPPQVMLLNVTALETFYERRTIYFWNTDNTALVPDVRYLPRTVPSEQQPTVIMEWLTGAPSPLLEGTVEPLPDSTALIGNVPAVSDGTLQINLTGQAVALEDADARRRLGEQLMWSLRPNLSAKLELRIDHQVQETFSGGDYLAANPGYSRFTGQPERFAVYNGQVRRLAESANATAPVPIIGAADNRDVRSAAMSSTGDMIYAALVVKDGDQQRLRIGAAPPDEQAELRTARLVGAIGHPSWAVTPARSGPGAAVGLVPAGGRLYGFAADAIDPRVVDWQGAPGRITSVAVAPDGRRVVVVAGGRLYLAVITASGDGGVQLGRPQPLRSVLREVTAADWSSEGFLAVAGVRTNSRVAIMDMSIDGAVQRYRLGDLGTDRITQLAAYPANPVSGAGISDWVAYMAGRGAYNALYGPARIVVGSLAPPAPAPVADVVPTAPFFLT